MTYSLKFKKSAMKEWKKLDPVIQNQFKKKLIERLETPHVSGRRLFGLENCYKIKLRSAGYRLVYEVLEKEICVIVIAVGKREHNFVYKKSYKRHQS